MTGYVCFLLYANCQQKYGEGENSFTIFGDYSTVQNYGSEFGILQHNHQKEVV